MQLNSAGRLEVCYPTSNLLCFVDKVIRYYFRINILRVAVKSPALSV